MVSISRFVRISSRHRSNDVVVGCPRMTLEIAVAITGLLRQFVMLKVTNYVVSKAGVGHAVSN